MKLHPTINRRDRPGLAQHLASAVPRSAFRVPRSTGAYSLMEVLLAVGIMSIIVVALYSIFNYTQRALRANTNQTDITEAGRATMDLLGRQLSQLSALDLLGASSSNGVLAADLFRSNATPSLFISVAGPAPSLRLAWFQEPFAYTSVVQELMPTTAGRLWRTNDRHAVFFVTRQAFEVTANAFWIHDVQDGVGSLGYYTTTWQREWLKWTNLFNFVIQQPATNFAAVADGVIHFRVVPYDSEGQAISWTNSPNYDYQPLLSTIYLSPDPVVDAERGRLRNTETRIAFLSNALPASIEIELGLLEPTALAQFRQLPRGSTFAQRFLSNHAAQVHLFRQRIPIWQAPPLLSRHSPRFSLP